MFRNLTQLLKATVITTTGLVGLFIGSSVAALTEEQQKVSSNSLQPFSGDESQPIIESSSLDLQSKIQLSEITLLDKNPSALSDLSSPENIDLSYPLQTTETLSDTTIKGEFLINTDTSDTERNPRVCVLSDGRFLVIWEKSQWHGQLYDTYGNKEGDEFQLTSSAGSNSNGKPNVSALDDGGFVVAYTFNGFSNMELYYRRFNASAIQVGTDTKVCDYEQNNGYPSVSGLDDGGFVFVWYGEDRLSYPPAIYRQQFYANGTKTFSNATIINAYSLDGVTWPVVSDLNNGYVSVWKNDYPDEIENVDVFAQLFDSSGSKAGSEFRVNSHTENSQNNPFVNKINNDTFIVTWLSGDSVTDVRGQLFKNSGEKVGNEMQISHYDVSGNWAVVSYSNTAGFIVAWEGRGRFNEDFTSICGQRFDESGLKIGPELLLSSTEATTRRNPSIDTFDDGRFIVVWERNDNIYGRIISLFATNTNQQAEYKEDVTTKFKAIEVTSTTTNSIEVKLSLSDPEAGELNTPSSGQTSSQYDRSTGIWTTLGTINEVNSLLPKLEFDPASDYKKNFTIALTIHDGIDLDIEDTITMNIFPVDDSDQDDSDYIAKLKRIFTIVGPVVGAGSTIGGFFYKLYKDNETRKPHYFADQVRICLKLRGASSFNSVNGQEFVKLMEGEFIDESLVQEGLLQKLQKRGFRDASLEYNEKAVNGDNQAMRYLRILAQYVAKAIKREIEAKPDCLGYVKASNIDMIKRMLSKIADRAAKYQEADRSNSSTSVFDEIFPGLVELDSQNSESVLNTSSST